MLKSNGLHRSKNLPVKFGFSPRTVPANIVKKLPLQRCFKPFLIPLFNFAHKRPTFAFTDESGYTLGFRRRIAHSGLHAETGTFPPPATARLCASSEIALLYHSIPPCFYIHTYISRFSVNPQHQQTRKIRQSCCHKFYPPTVFHPAFQLLAQMAQRLLSLARVGTTLGFRRKIAHKGTHGETGGVLGGGWYHYPRSVPHVSETLRGQGVERQTLPLLGLGRGCSRRTQKAFGTAMRLCVSLSRRRRGPAGLRDPVSTLWIMW